MAAGSASISITIPVTNATDPTSVSRAFVVAALQQAAQAIGSGPAVSGNLAFPTFQGAPTNVGTWTLTVGT